MLRIAVVEDEEKCRIQLKEYLTRFQKEHLEEFQVDYFTDGDEILENYRKDYDLILMDIMMQFTDGMSTAEEIRKQDDAVTIIFITNMQNYAIRGYQVRAFDYILKPFTYFGLEKSISRAISRIDKVGEKDYFTINASNQIFRIPMKEIFYIESDAHYLNIHTSRGEFRTYMRMQDAEKLVPANSFYRINKGILVAFRHVERVEDNCCVICGQLLPISRAKRREFMEVLTRFFMSY